MSLVTVDITSYNAFKSATIDNGYNVDGINGYQAEDLAMLLAGNAGRTSPYWLCSDGGVTDPYFSWSVDSNKAYNVADYFALVYNKDDVQRGDIIILETLVGFSKGHLGFADNNWNAGTTTAFILGQNQEDVSYTVGDIVTLKLLNVNSFVGGFRFKAWNSTPPTPPPTPPEPPTPSVRDIRNFKWALYARMLRDKRRGM